MPSSSLTPLEVRSRIREISRTIRALEELFRVASIPCDLFAPLYRWRAELSGSLVSCLCKLPPGLPTSDVLREEGIT